MSVILPNSFSCIARTAVFDGGEQVDFRSMAQPGLPVELADQLQTCRFLVTTSKVKSTVSPHHSIEFTETLLKVPVQVRGKDYLFPVVTFVDHEYSLIRGYLLGFNKRFAAPNPECENLVLHTEGVDVDLRAEPSRGASAEATPPEQEYPILLWTDYAVGTTVRSSGFATLDIEAYERQYLHTKMRISRTVHTVGHSKVTACQLYEIRDTFVITGTLPIIGLPPVPAADRLASH
ncbi:acetoacetate decarboxylase family protein [Streptomyces canus]|uniref:hypothetical protein n=1 Tax=Streptomyces canus TaxID=58343 RepID=UPI0022513350|nr:hypothetical protein [Streptomyces canus]MCX5256830.1 acetoacetate decarboxylase family protein [Streptomyces canus]